MLKDKVCVITGSARGIGYAIAEEFAKNGAKVVLSDPHQSPGSTHLRSRGHA